ncbi:uncharacterized protein PHACADRAFT_257046 [Phanerochaete carnosa HHB-10118-sp]|uniref:Uncharacterized protein n=1 Tax=Phanerochaete carnosa (strain HHB-10118-sp) TaxID=650164 RepID=K5V0M2_PHACS|nr:uncharacterized protein PHACADRAFT_257046 [Phanerochaete carnosa HHB-10118-sp]EKM56026.1 hypothetical protein PHACADRAFT_257046 [Phanerochaete carnosa HHB-10118-sp]
MLETLSRFRLHTLDLYVNWECDQTLAGHSRAPGPIKNDPYIEKLDLVAIAQHAMRCLPALQLIAIDNADPLRRQLFEVANSEVGSQSSKALAKLVTGSTGWEKFNGSIMHKPWWDANCSWYWGE